MCEYERNVGKRTVIFVKKPSKRSDHLQRYSHLYGVAAMVKGQKYIVAKKLACFDKTISSIKSHFTHDVVEEISI